MDLNHKKIQIPKPLSALPKDVEKDVEVKEITKEFITKEYLLLLQLFKQGDTSITSHNVIKVLENLTSLHLSKDDSDKEPVLLTLKRLDHE